MKLHNFLILHALLVISTFSFSFTNTRSGFFLPDSVQEFTLKFKTVNNLIILPVIINDSIQVNLILDTGCRNLVLFGKRFQKLLDLNYEKEILFSGLGAGAPVKGLLSLNNQVSIQSVLGQLVPVIVVADKNLFGKYADVHGVIGYDIFLKFEIEINSREETITFRPALHTIPPYDYARVPLEVVDSRPVMQSSIFFDSKTSSVCPLMIDTGSSLGLLLKTTDISQFESDEEKILIGRGLNGLLYGYKTIAMKLKLKGFEIKHITTGIIHSDWHNHASIGMDILKDYIVVLNYCKSYACFKKLV